MRGGGYAFAGAEALQRTPAGGRVQMRSGKAALRGAGAGESAMWAGGACALYGYAPGFAPPRRVRYGAKTVRPLISQLR